MRLFSADGRVHLVSHAGRAAANAFAFRLPTNGDALLFPEL